MSLGFTPSGHQYRLDGKRVQGVTTIIGNTVPKPQLIPWAARKVAEFVADNEHRITELRADGRTALVNYLKTVPENARDTAAIRGTDVHLDAAAIVEGRDDDVKRLPHAVDYVLSYEEFLTAWRPAPVLVEFSCANRRHWYAGMGDAVFDLPTDVLDSLPAKVADLLGTRPIIDLKTSRGIYPSVAYQTAGYRYAEFYLDADGNEQSMSELGITGAACVHITPFGCDVYPLDAGPDTFQTFTYMAHLSRQLGKSKHLVYDLAPTPRRAA